MPDRQPVHTVYGGAHLFVPDTTTKLGAIALRTLQEYAPDAGALAGALGLDRDLAARIYPRIVDKLEREPVEDYRIDFEDGFGNRPDDEEDAVAKTRRRRRRRRPGGAARCRRASASASRRSATSC